MYKLAEFFIDHFWAIAATVLSSAFIGYIAYRNNRITRMVAAASAFRSAINVDVFEGLSGHQLHNALLGVVTGTGIKIEGEFFKHKRAVHEYRVHLGWFDRIRLHLAWKKYHGGNEECLNFFAEYCIKENGPSVLKERLVKLRSVGNKR